MQNLWTLQHKICQLGQNALYCINGEFFKGVGPGADYEYLQLKWLKNQKKR